jgi:hypothetical protein
VAAELLAQRRDGPHRRGGLLAEENRANSAAEITGSGTACVIASSIVQRPSPESST